MSSFAVYVSRASKQIETQMVQARHHSVHASIKEVDGDDEIFRRTHRKKKVNKSTLSHYREDEGLEYGRLPFTTTQIIVESMLMGEPDDLTLLPNGTRIDRKGFP